MIIIVVGMLTKTDVSGLLYLGAFVWDTLSLILINSALDHNSGKAKEKGGDDAA
jgi:hypothetical protein